MQPLVSVIIPVYNVEKYLRQCLDSIINQTLKDIEIICVDDGSTDKSLEILREYCEKDNRIKILTQKNKYAGVARNNGLKIATGKYLSFLDSDDWFDLNMLEEMYNKAEKDQSDIVICGWYNYNNITKSIIKVVTFEQRFLSKSPFKPQEFPNDLFTIGKSNPWTKLFKREFFIENNLLFENCKVCNDMTCVCTALAIANKISIINKPFIFYRNNQTTNLSSKRLKNRDSVLYAVKQLENNLIRLNLYEYFKEAFNKQKNSSLGYKLIKPHKKYKFF